MLIKSRIRFIQSELNWSLYSVIYMYRLSIYVQCAYTVTCRTIRSCYLMHIIYIDLCWSAHFLNGPHNEIFHLHSYFLDYSTLIGSDYSFQSWAGRYEDVLTQKLRYSKVFANSSPKSKTYGYMTRTRCLQRMETKKLEYYHELLLLLSPLPKNLKILGKIWNFDSKLLELNYHTKYTRM